MYMYVYMNICYMYVCTCTYEYVILYAKLVELCFADVKLLRLSDVILYIALRFFLFLK